MSPTHNYRSLYLILSNRPLSPFLLLLHYFFLLVLLIMIQFVLLDTLDIGGGLTVPLADMCTSYIYSTTVYNLLYATCTAKVFWMTTG